MKILKILIIVFFIVLFISFPYLIWKDSVQFAPDIFLTEWYKTILITVLFGLFYKYIIEKKIDFLLISKRTNLDLQTILTELNTIEVELKKNEDLTKKSLKSIKLIIQTNHNQSYLHNTLNDIEEIEKNINQYFDQQDRKDKNEMKKAIFFKIKKLRIKLQNKSSGI